MFKKYFILLLAAVAVAMFLLGGYLQPISGIYAHRYFNLKKFEISIPPSACSAGQFPDLVNASGTFVYLCCTITNQNKTCGSPQLLDNSWVN